PHAGPGRGADQGAHRAGGGGHPVRGRGRAGRAVAGVPRAARLGRPGRRHQRAQAQLRLPLLDHLRRRGAGDAQRRGSLGERRCRQRAARAGRADGRRGRVLLRRAAGGRGVRAACAGAGMRRAGKLDKVRWLIVYSTDFVYLFTLISLAQVYVMWQQGVPAPISALAAVLAVLLVVLAMRAFRLAVRVAPRPTALLAVAGVASVLLSVVPLIASVPVWPAMMTPWVRRRTVLLVSAGLMVLVNGILVVVAG